MWKPTLGERAWVHSGVRILNILQVIDVTSDVLFIHHQPSLRNIGDELCSPKHYFSFESGGRRVAVLGGGVFSDLGQHALAAAGVAPQDAVLWAIGRSNTVKDSVMPAIAQLPHAGWGLRDIDGVIDKDRFLPCVSCLHPMLDDGIDGGGTLLFLNADPRVTPRQELRQLSRIARARGWNILLNDCSDSEMRAALRLNERVITNSFHGAYWGLLSGHQVAIAGYSSKFDSLLRAFGLEGGEVVRYEKARRPRLIDRILHRGSSGLCQSVERSARGDMWLSLPSSREVLTRFRNLNLAFAEAQVRSGAFAAVRPLSFGP